MNLNMFPLLSITDRSGNLFTGLFELKLYIEKLYSVLLISERLVFQV